MTPTQHVLLGVLSGMAALMVVAVALNWRDLSLRYTSLAVAGMYFLSVLTAPLLLEQPWVKYVWNLTWASFDGVLISILWLKPKRFSALRVDLCVVALMTLDIGMHFARFAERFFIGGDNVKNLLPALSPAINLMLVLCLWAVPAVAFSSWLARKITTWR